MINKGCEVNYCFKHGFILNEEHLQTISSMITARYEKEELIYKITKSNSHIYQTSDITEIFKEENSNANLINKLDIIIDNGDIINFSLCFEKGGESSLKIIGIDKDRIFLLFNEIKTYVEKEVTIAKTFLAYNILQSICSWISLLLMTGLMFFTLLSIDDFNSERLDDALNSSDALDKLNYLIQRGSIYGTTGHYSYILVAMVVLSMFIMFLPKLLNVLWGKNGVLRITDYFLFGKQKTIYEKKVKVKNNIIWTVCIGLLVSIVAGFLVYIFTK